jgi:soluble lytic murein transglycosylase
MRKELSLPRTETRQEGDLNVFSAATMVGLTLALMAASVLAYESEAVPAGFDRSQSTQEIESELTIRLPQRQQQDSRRMAEAIKAASVRFQLSPSIILAVMQTESSFRFDARSHVGAVGLMQVKPATAKEMARRYRIAYEGAHDLLDPVKNIFLGSAYLSHLRDRFGDTHRYLAAYNIGPRNLRRQLKKGSLGRGRIYAKKVHGRRLAYLAADI